MNLQYSGTKKTLAKERELTLKGLSGNKVDEQRADAVNHLVDTFLKDKSIDDTTNVSVTAVTSTNAMSVNITLNQQTFIPPAAPALPSEASKPLTKSAEKEKQAANAKTITKKVERVKAPKESGQPQK
jgi:hypothetical protein